MRTQLTLLWVLLGLAVLSASSVQPPDRAALAVKTDDLTHDDEEEPPLLEDKVLAPARISLKPNLRNVGPAVKCAWNGTKNFGRRAWNGTKNFGRRAWNGTKKVAKWLAEKLEISIDLDMPNNNGTK
ncbi:unnamed protein product [Dibothriocephalus latus]|uniref:Uncharacterized protein n=1 Tax=Dibothriocephalus latus TaxID=60516 RepID=A0A3P7P4Y8_DIBLA|nr:unnamed protein product [Dibothriocephalus latus]